MQYVEKKTFWLKPKTTICILNAPFSTRDILFDIHCNISFKYIYMRVLKVRASTLFFDKNIIFKFLFVLATGVNWLWVKLFKRYPTQTINIRDILLNEFTTTNSNMILFVEKEIWKHNNFYKNVERLIYDYCESRKFSAHVTREILSKLKYSFNIKIESFNILKHPITGHLMKFKSNSSFKDHIVTSLITKQDLTYITYVGKAKKNNNYDKEMIIDEFMFEKNGRVLHQNEANMEQLNYREILIPKNEIILGAIKSGYAGDLISEPLNSAISTTIEFTKMLEEIGEMYNIDK